MIIVLMYDKSQPRHLWKLGRILELIRSKDGVVRAARVILRSVWKCFKLTIEQIIPNRNAKTEKRCRE